MQHGDEDVDGGEIETWYKEDDNGENPLRDMENDLCFIVERYIYVLSRTH
jgi:hypothetical protein